ncbi:hypothetical protein [Streptomyces natalensis]|uniref:Uncharacterized protein n=1 Tax=Streptomyces natalensis ATCC 27448 TaxID=1240678 RepID=A0A0D7CQE5_9ACTN|nr:hypothetical protein [Streptomyces natalensis]KIZ18095.1 hypothetical protein SNA_08675 [Streptomyces natalensis ATCC 27448]
MSVKKTPAAHMQAASEAVRRHNHAAMAGGYDSTPEVSHAVIALVEMCGRLLQATEHMSGRVFRDLDAGVLDPDDGTAPEEHARGAELALLDARLALSELLGQLQLASGHLWHLGMVYEPEETEA